MPDLGVVVPFYNEQATAGPVAKGLLDALDASGLDFEAAFVADGSSDGTVAELRDVAGRRREVQILWRGEAEGYGAAILHGFSRLTADYVGWLDGDGQVPPEALLSLLAAMRGTDAPLGMGQRVQRQDGVVRRVASRGYNWLMRRLTGFPLPDINAKPKLLRRDLLHEINPTSRDWFIDTEIVAGAFHRGYPVVRIPVPFLERRHGSSKVRLGIVAEYVGNLRRFRADLRDSGSLRRAAPANLGRVGDAAASGDEA
jgi:glycosyltransferase involved in cell wall biosynthesis